ncbi:MAG: DUF5063 domain-containing protein [Bacteroidales bacterium]|nr:DUF5063 domain-containing protein [Bacteroidales bacterium]
MNEETKLPDNIIYSQEIIEFVTVANEFCKILENLNDFSLKSFVENVYKISSLLHLKALGLPKPEISNKMPSETFITEADWHYIDSAISKKLGQYEVYTDLFEPGDTSAPVNISMSECLTDTYQDLKDFTKIYQIAGEDEILNAITDCKSNFEQLWGSRIIIVLKEFHNLLYGNEELKEEDTDISAEIAKGKNWVDNIFTDE